TEKDADTLSSTAKAYFPRIPFAVRRMQKLIEALLSYSRANTSEINLESTDLNKIVDEVKHDLNEVIKEKNAVIETCNLPRIKAIPLQFHQLFLNLISNAIKYSKPNVQPHIKITAELIDGEDLLSIDAVKEQRYWKL